MFLSLFLQYYLILQPVSDQNLNVLYKISQAELLFKMKKKKKDRGN